MRKREFLGNADTFIKYKDKKNKNNIKLHKFGSVFNLDLELLI